MKALRIGLVAHTQLQQRSLRLVAEECGHRVERSLLVGDIHPALSEPAELDAWVVALDAEAEAAEDGQDSAVDSWLEQLECAVIFCDGVVPAQHEQQFATWARRLKEKLGQLSGSINLSRDGGSARDVWVLAASTGGPAAVKQFLSELPPRLGVGFIYVQHIDTGFKDTLAQVMSRGTHYPAQVVEHGSVVRSNEVAIVSPERATELLPNGSFVVDNRPWSAPYRPSADYIVANVANRYGKRSGVIVFTGMGDDGAAGSRLMRQKGGQVWVQTPSTCTSDSMPLATLATGCVGFKGNPFSLAKQLVIQVRSTRGEPALTPCDS